jgi:VIT1/CCC1 family predicted Fe2+/Mn2+ transporter
MHPVSPKEERRRILDPLARVSEILFGVIMALTFTTTIDAASGGRGDVRTLLFAVVGCNLAWGLVDAVMFLMNALTGRGRDLLTVRSVRDAATAGDAHVIIADAIGPLLSSILTADDLERVRQGLARLEDLPARPRLEKEDWLGALGVFLLVFLSTFPIVLPFLLFANVRVGLRVSNLVAIVMLFGCGYTLARYGGHRPLTTAFTMVGLGVILVAITIALGG